jgi:hypothetical protein
MKWISHATWPEGCPVKESDDTHDTQEQAEGVCCLLREHGFGGNYQHFPTRTWVTPLEDKLPDWFGKPAVLIPHLKTIGPIDPKWARIFNG